MSRKILHAAFLIALLSPACAKVTTTVPSGKNIVILQGMHGMLTYSVHPESILDFRPVGGKLPN